MADVNGGHLVARTLRQAGVGHVFTLCGGHILPIYDGCLTEGVSVVDMRHEQACAHAADAYARLTRNIGVALAEAGCSFEDVVRVRYLLPNRDDFEPCWPVLRRTFGAAPPAATMQVCGLSDSRMRIEIEVDARRP